jgi:FAD-dependent urate hydroxylase
MEKHALHVSIIGGGIGGLAAAAALQRQGIQVTVFERNPELREIGAVLTLWANGVQVLRHLGFDDPLTAVSARLTSFECWSWRGKRLGGIRLGSIERRVGAPSVGIHRADLLRLLAGAIDRESIHVHADCVGFSEEQEHVIAHFADGHDQQTDLLVGADGLYSVIREQVLGKAPPRYSGYTRFSWGRLLRGCTRLPRAFPARRGVAVGASVCCR